MKEYRLFSEWRNKVLYGENFKDALTRAGKLQRPDRFEGGVKIEEGEVAIIAKVIGLKDPTSILHTRGTAPIVTALIELSDQRIVDVDAEEREMKIIE